MIKVVDVADKSVWVTVVKYSLCVEFETDFYLVKIVFLWMFQKCLDYLCHNLLLIGNIQQTLFSQNDDEVCNKNEVYSFFVIHLTCKKKKRKQKESSWSCAQGYIYCNKFLY